MRLEHIGQNTNSDSKDSLARNWHQSGNSESLGACCAHGLASSGGSTLGGSTSTSGSSGGRAVVVITREGRRGVFAAKIANVLLAIVLTLLALGVGCDTLGQELVANKCGHGLGVVLQAGGRVVGGARAVVRQVVL